YLDPSEHSDDKRQEIAQEIRDIVYQMRFAGGSIMSALPGQRATWQRPALVVLGDDENEHTALFRKMRRAWLPGFALVGRDDLLGSHLLELQRQDPGATTLDAWLDLSRHNRWAVIRQEKSEATGDIKETVEWESNRKQ